MANEKKNAKTNTTELQAAIQSLIAKGKKEGMIRAADLQAHLDKLDLSPETIEKIYGTPRTEWSPLVEECVRGVFFQGWQVTDEPIMFYYAEDLCESPWHESRPFVLQIKNTRFFK